MRRTNHSHQPFQSTSLLSTTLTVLYRVNEKKLALKFGLKLIDESKRILSMIASNFSQQGHTLFTCTLLYFFLLLGGREDFEYTEYSVLSALPARLYNSVMTYCAPCYVLLRNVHRLHRALYS